MFGLGGKTIGVDELAHKLVEGDPVLIDVREPDEFAAGHVPGAVNVPLGQLAGRIDELDADADTYLICQTGHRSATAAKFLKRAGFANARSVKGGTSAWRGPLER
jgi:rhodanese-related sulfurtransferase